MASNKACVEAMNYLEQPSLHAIHTNIRPLVGHSPVHECMFVLLYNYMCKASSTYEDNVYGQSSQQASEATYQFLLVGESSGGMLGMRLVLECYI